MTLAEAKAEMRRAAALRRAEAQAGAPADPAVHLGQVLAGQGARPLSAYVAMRSEIDPAPALAVYPGPIGLPVVAGKGLPLRFARWRPGEALVPGAYGAAIPQGQDWMVPQVVIVPLLAFDRAGGRLGYGGGFYDRTLATLRAAGPVLAIGFAWSAQEVPQVPRDATDQPLDLIVTEEGVIRPDP